MARQVVVVQTMDMPCLFSDCPYRAVPAPGAEGSSACSLPLGAFSNVTCNVDAPTVVSLTNGGMFINLSTSSNPSGGYPRAYRMEVLHWEERLPGWYFESGCPVSSSYTTCFSTHDFEQVSCVVRSCSATPGTSARLCLPTWVAPTLPRGLLHLKPLPASRCWSPMTGPWPWCSLL